MFADYQGIFQMFADYPGTSKCLLTISMHSGTPSDVGEYVTRQYAPCDDEECVPCQYEDLPWYLLW